MRTLYSVISRWTVAGILANVVLLWALVGTAQERPGDRVRLLNGQLLQAYEQLLSNPGVGAGIRAQAAVLLEQRAVLLRSMVEQNPAEALRLAWSADLLSEIAAAIPAGRQHLETHGRWEGAIEYVVEDSVDFRTHRNIRRMTAGEEVLYIHFAGAEPAGLQSGDLLRVEGVRFGDQVAADSGSVQVAAKGRPQPPPPPPCSTLGVQNSIVLMVTMPGAAIPPEVTQPLLQSIFFNTGQAELSLTDYWRENSYGVTTAIGDIAPGTSGGWYTLDRVYTDDETIGIRTAAIAAADPDVDFRQYSRVFIVMNGATPVANPGYSGRGTLSCSTLSSADGNFNASTSWLKSGSMGEQLRGAHLVIHEAGHNIGLHHSNSRDFDTEALGAPGAAGVLAEYNDVFAEMGRSFGHYAAPHKARAGWLPTQVRTVTGSGSYTVQPLELPGTVQALKIRRGANDENWLWVEYRQPLGIYDTKLAAPFVFGRAPNQIFLLDAADSHIYTGGLIHYEDATTGNRTHLLDLTPGSLSGNMSTLVPDDWLDTALSGSWTDAYTGLTITISNPTSSSLTVDVVYGSGPCIESDPAVTLSPSNPSAKRGQSVTYQVSVANNDTTPCTARTFDIASSLPSGWATAFSQTQVTIEAGASAAVTMTKTIPANATAATYAVDVTATSGASTGTGTASVTVKPGK